MKIIEGLKPYEVMRLHEEEGKRVAFRYKKRSLDDGWTEANPAKWNTELYEYAIIDDSQPEIDWSGFDWDFFNQYGGLPVDSDGEYKLDGFVHFCSNENKLRESPFYPWFGGERPVPENVEVEVKVLEEDNQSISVVIDTEAGVAGAFVWSGNDDTLPIGDIIAFRLTGKVL